MCVCVCVCACLCVCACVGVCAGTSYVDLASSSTSDDDDGAPAAPVFGGPDNILLGDVWDFGVRVSLLEKMHLRENPAIKDGVEYHVPLNDGGGDNVDVCCRCVSCIGLHCSRACADRCDL